MQSSAVILVTGGCGSFGRSFVDHALASAAAEVRVFSRDEGKHDAMRTALRSDRVKFYVGDVRDRASIDGAMRGVDAVFHAAALKQVPSCEFFPLEAVRTNIVGSENVVRSAIAHSVGSVVCLSTDKAVFPVNAMGMSKALMEKVAQAAARELGPRSKTRILRVRYGNVMYSRGSVIPLFVRQVRTGQAMTITEPKMTRFLMPLAESVDLVDHAMDSGVQGDLFIRKAPAATVEDVADAVRKLEGRPDHPITCIGWRHGEKLHETLASASEVESGEDQGAYFRIPLDERDLNYGAFFEKGSTTKSVFRDFSSDVADRLSVGEVGALIRGLPEYQADHLGTTA